MKILNLTWKYGTGGIARCFDTYAQLGEVNKDVNVLSVCIDPQCFDYDRQRLYKLGVTCVQIKNTHDFSWHRKLSDIIKTYQPDVVFAHGLHGAIVYVITRLLHRHKVPLVGSFHGLYYAPTTKKRLAAPFYNQLMIFIYRHYCKRVVAVSFYSKSELEQRRVPHDKIFVVHNGIKDIKEVPKKQTDDKDECIRIGVVSRLDPFKGIDILLQALVLVKEQTKKKVHLDIVGDGPMSVELQAFIESHHIDNDVNLAGYQSNIPEWMDSWDIFCLPSYFENHSISILEAMRAGRAIVTTNVGGNGESIANGKEGVLVPAKDADSLANALLLLIENHPFRESLGQNARFRFVNEFTEETTKHNIIKSLTL